MKNIKKQSGFTTVELLITLFIAAAFLMSGYQLYSLIIKDGGDARATAKASNVAYDYLQRYKPSATNPCTAQTPLTDSQVTTNVDTLSNVTVTVAITCPYSATPSVSKVTVTLKYNTPQQTVISSTYAATTTATTTTTLITAIAAITGTTTVGNVLTAGALTPSGATVTYQWQSAATAGGTYTDISGATNSTYTLVSGNAGKYIKVVATATGSYTGTQTSAASAVVTSPPTQATQGPLSPGTMADFSTIAIVDSYSESNYSTTFGIQTAGRKIGQTFQSGGGILNSAKFYLNKSGSPVGNIFATLYATSGTFGVDENKTGSALATSGLINVSTLSTSSGLITFNFTGANKYALANGVVYAIMLEADFTVNATNYYSFGIDATSPAHAGAHIIDTTRLTDRDSLFYVYSDYPGPVAWSNPDNAKVSDNVYATFNAYYLTGGASHYLKATNFGFSIPTGATINGILVEFEAKTNTSFNTFNGRIIKNGNISTYNWGGEITGVSTTEKYGSIPYSGDGNNPATFLWSETGWTSAIINSSDFGIALYGAAQGSNQICSVDHIRITVYYTTY